MLNSAQEIDKNNNLPMQTSYIQHLQPSSAFYEDIFGLGKAAKAKKEAKIDKKQAKADSIRAKAQAKLELAKLGVAPKSGAQGIIGGLLGAATQIFGGDGAAIAGAVTGNEQTEPTPMAGQPMPVLNPNEEKPKMDWKKYMPFIIGGSVLVVGVVIYFIVRKKK
jgi:hypothetical protein